MSRSTACTHVILQVVSTRINLVELLERRQAIQPVSVEVVSSSWVRWIERVSEQILCQAESVAARRPHGQHVRLFANRSAQGVNLLRLELLIILRSHPLNVKRWAEPADRTPMVWHLAVRLETWNADAWLVKVVPLHLVRLLLLRSTQVL